MLGKEVLKNRQDGCDPVTCSASPMPLKISANSSPLLSQSFYLPTWPSSPRDSFPYELFFPTVSPMSLSIPYMIPLDNLPFTVSITLGNQC